jgi:hypothetical protein
VIRSVSVLGYSLNRALHFLADAEVFLGAGIMGCGHLTLTLVTTLDKSGKNCFCVKLSRKLHRQTLLLLRFLW